MMLRLWSQVARPQINCNCVACSSSVAGVLARRTASATTRRRLKFVDAFTILLAPVFATAFVADANWKDRRRREWDRRIAEVEGEVARLHRQESQILRSFSSRVDAHRKRLPHVRSYSTDVRLRVLGDDIHEDVDAPQWRSTELELEIEGDDDATHTSAREGPKSPVSYPQVMKDTADAVRRIERLVALKLAIKMLLHVNVGTSPRFKDANPGNTHEPKKMPEDFNGLVEQLKTVRQSLRQLNSASERPSVSAPQKMPRNEQAAIDSEIRHHAHDFKLGNVSVTRLLIRIANSITRSPEPPSVKSYVPLMMAFSRARLDELSYLVMAAIDEGRLTLSKQSLFKVLWQYGKNRDANRFELFLNSVAKTDDVSRYTHPWEWRIINDVELPCPVSNDSRLLQILVYTALKCNQPHRAEAWASQLKYSDTPTKHTSHVLRNFMKFYATHRDWRRGQLWLSAALDWSVSPGPQVIRDLQRVVFAMLELCVACGKQEAYKSILQSAVHARVGVFRAEADLKFTERSKAILAEWDKLHNSRATCAEHDCSPASGKARDFCDEATRRLEALRLTRTSTRFEWPTPASANFEFRRESSEVPPLTASSVGDWRELCKQQAAELGKVKAQLAEMRWLLSRNAASEIGEGDSQASSSLSTSTKPSQTTLPVYSVNRAPNNLAEYSTSLPSPPKIVPLSLNIAPTASSEANQESNRSNSGIGLADSDLEQTLATNFPTVVDPRPRQTKSFPSEDRTKATASGEGHFNSTQQSKPTSTQEGLRDGNAIHGIQATSSSNPISGLPTDSSPSDVLTDSRPFTAVTDNLGQGGYFSQGRNASLHKPDAVDGSSEQPPGIPVPNRLVTMSRLIGEATHDHPSCASDPSSKNSIEVLKTMAEPQMFEPSNQTKEGQWISFLKMPRSRHLSARATLRHIHLQKPEPPKPAKPDPPEGAKYKEKKPPPTTTLRLSRMPAPRAVKFVNGEFKSLGWSTKKVETYSAKVRVRPIYNGR
jgi:hypothetical protein